MKKIILILIVLIITFISFLLYKIYTPKPINLDISVDENDIISLEEKLSIIVPDITKINENEETITIKEYEYKEVTLTNEETSVLMNLAISSIIPCSNVQAICHDNYIEVTALVKLTDEIIEMVDLPKAFLPDKVAGFISVLIDNTNVSVNSINLNGINIPNNLQNDLSYAISNVLKDYGIKEIKVYENEMVVKGNLPSKFE